jgi:hypothetical protein
VRPRRAQKRGYQGASTVCPDCRDDARFQRHLPRDVLTVNGPVELSRAYYHCSHCDHGYFPLDQRLGLSGRYSPGVLPLITLAGTEEPFRQAHDLLKRLAGLDVSASSCRRVTQTIGAELDQQHARGEAVPPPSAPAWDFRLRDEHSQPTETTVAYVGVDAFAVPTRAADGSVCWRMLSCGLLYDPAKKHSWYVADFDRHRLADTLRHYACTAGLNRAATVVALTDGGNGLEALLTRHVSGALVFVLDFWHACQHLHAWSKLRFGRDSPQAASWAGERVTLLREQGGTALLGRLAQEALPEGASEEVVEEWRRLVGYFTDNEHRTDYPTYRSRGWDIGSGPVEAECKVLAGRLKHGGMRWLEPGAEEVAGLRALYHSGDGLWDAFWEQRRRRLASPNSCTK